MKTNPLAPSDRLDAHGSHLLDPSSQTGKTKEIPSFMMQKIKKNHIPLMLLGDLQLLPTGPSTPIPQAPMSLVTLFIIVAQEGGDTDLILASKCLLFQIQHPKKMTSKISKNGPNLSNQRFMFHPSWPHLLGFSVDPKLGTTSIVVAHFAFHWRGQPGGAAPRLLRHLGLLPSPLGLPATKNDMEKEVEKNTPKRSCGGIFCISRPGGKKNWSQQLAGVLEKVWKQSWVSINSIHFLR